MSHKFATVSEESTISIFRAEEYDDEANFRGISNMTYDGLPLKWDASLQVSFKKTYIK
jgi:hypothetical protein